MEKVICVTIDENNDAVWVHDVTDGDNPVDVTDRYVVSAFPIDDGDPETLVSGFHIGLRLPRAEVIVD